MKLFMSCKNKCSVCASCDFCVPPPCAEDYFILAEKDEIIRRIDTGRFKRKHELMKDVLWQCYNYRYDDKVQESYWSSLFIDVGYRNMTARLIMGDNRL